MSELIGIVQQIIQNTIKAMKITDMVTGTVVSVSPLSVQSDIAAQIIPERALLLTESVRQRIESVRGGNGGTVEIHKGLAVGDKVLMLQVSQGQRYIVMSKQ